MSTKLSETYGQLAKIFQALETAHFHEGKDYGENITGCFKWFISPPALIYLEKRANVHWTQLKHNERFSWGLEIWEGYTSKGANINLVL